MTSSNTIDRELHMNPVVETNLPFPDRRQGKVRDIYRLPSVPGKPPRLALIATDRISAFDVVLPTPIPGKGRLLTEISVKWFELLREQRIIGDHLLSTRPAELPGLSKDQIGELTGRTMICRATQVVPIECVVRGYLAGSGWKEYQKTGMICGETLPRGLKQCEQLPEPIFTPATKAEAGHDENIDFETAGAMVGGEVMEKLRDLSLDLYHFGSDYAQRRGVILADTKFEFGFALDAGEEPTSEILLIDEALTPDSSRYWPAEEYQPDRDQNSFDKQYVRNYLIELVEKGLWNKTAPGPELPEDVVRNTLARYVEARDRLFGQG